MSTKAAIVIAIAGVLMLAWVVSFVGEPPGDDAATATEPTATQRPAQPVSIQPTPTRYNQQKTVVYRVTAPEGSLTFSNGQGGTEQLDMEERWTKTYFLSPGAHAYVAVQNKRASGTVTCEILVDGIPWKTSESEGAYKIATCSGLVGVD
jgi:hypothetical protein